MHLRPPYFAPYFAPALQHLKHSEHEGHMAEISLRAVKEYALESEATSSSAMPLAMRLNCGLRQGEHLSAQQLVAGFWLANQRWAAHTYGLAALGDFPQ